MILRTLLFFLIVGSVLGGSFMVLPNATSNEIVLPSKIIDAHTHLDVEASVLKEYEDQAAKFNVVGALSHSSRSNPIPESPPKSERIEIVSCGAVVPDITLEQMEKALEDKRIRCLKIYLGYVDKYASDPFYAPFYSLAERQGVPVVFHTGDTQSKKALLKFADPLTIDEIAVGHPTVKFVLAHMGNPWIQSAAEVAYKNDNVYVDTSALLIDDVSKKKPEVVDALLIKPIQWFFYYVENPQKMLFGTDWSLAELGPYLMAVLGAVPKEHWDDIFYNNARSVFGFER